MINKKCFKCQRKKPIDMFYKHPQMGDGYLNKCKLCTKKDVKRRYYDPDSRIKIIEYEKERFQDVERKLKVAKYQKTMRAKNPSKFKARNKVSNAVRDNRITKLPCEVCGESKVEAHHTDYRSPLKVIWLCRQHHMEEEGKITYLK